MKYVKDLNREENWAKNKRTLRKMKMNGCIERKQRGKQYLWEEDQCRWNIFNVLLQNVSLICLWFIETNDKRVKIEARINKNISVLLKLENVYSMF